ncbi:MAG: YraN family protein [Aquificae bacterium]|nr:YraN family protein [Aquificota bacterium]
MRGRYYEELALSYLLSVGYTLLGRNLRTPYGEIDLLLKDGDELVVVEVKGGRLGLERFDKRKFLKVVRSAYALLDEPFRVDLVVVDKGKVHHFKNVGYEYGEEELQP